MAVIATDPTNPNAPSFAFTQGDSNVSVQPSPTLQDLASIRASVIFNLSPGGPIGRRYNLMEGQLSFAFFVESDGSLTATILDRDGNWTGAKSPANLVTINAWHTAELQHDGINRISIFLDGTEVGSTYNARGPVRSVGPRGIAIGHWPEPPSVYTFAGYIREAKLYKYDPQRDANGLLNLCCMDRKALDAAVQELHRRGATAESVAAKGQEILQFGYDVLAEVRGSDPNVTQQQQQLSNAALAAYLRADQTAYTTAFAQLAALAMTRLDAQKAQALHDRQDELISSLPLPFDDLKKLLAAMCWDRVGIDPQQLVDTIQHLRQPGSPNQKGT